VQSSSQKVKTVGSTSKPTGGKTTESDVKPSEMLLDLNDDCEFAMCLFLPRPRGAFWNSAIRPSVYPMAQLPGL